MFTVHLLGGYYFSPLKVFTSLSLLDIGGGAGINYEIIPRLHLLASLEGGYFHGFLHNGEGNGGNAFFSGRIGSSYRIIPQMGLGLEVGFRYFLGFATDFRFSLSGSWYPKQKIYNTFEVKETILEPVYPELFRHYDEYPLGRTLLQNSGEADLEKIEVSLFIEGLMEKPRPAAAPVILGPGGEEYIELHTLFNENILNMSSEEELSGEILIKHKAKGWKFKQAIPFSLPLMGSSPLNGNDPKKLSLFVTSQDLTIRHIAGEIQHNIYEKAVKTIDERLLKTIGTYKTLSLYGIDIHTSPPDFSDIPSIQFPKQTLERRKGSSLDASLLTAALLEAMGIETVLITGDETIVLGIRLYLEEDEIQKQFSHEESFIPFDGGIIIPLLLNDFSQPFLTAWQNGAAAYAGTAGRSSILDIRESWKSYRQTGFSPLLKIPPLPGEEKLVEAYLEDISLVINWEIAPRVIEFEKEIAGTENSVTDTINLGALYGKYGQFDKAAEYLDEVLLREENVNALVNMGNIFYLQNQFRMALPYYERAYARDPFSPVVLLAMARVNHSLENYGNTEFAYDKLMNIDEDLAQRFSYLQYRGEEAAAMSEESNLNGVVLWMEE